VNRIRWKYAMAELLCWWTYSLVGLVLYYLKPSWFGIAAMLIGTVGMARYTAKALDTLKLL